MDFEKKFLKETFTIKIKNLEVLITDLLFELYDFKTYEHFEKYVIKNMSYDIISSDFIIIKDDKKDIFYFIKNQNGMLHMHVSYKHEYCTAKSKGDFFEVKK